VNVQGTDTDLKADTICIHGDGANALRFAQEISKSLTQAGISIRKVSDII
jgi:5-oxoprolinase (ATP-hydrolysing) subunit A